MVKNVSSEPKPKLKDPVADEGTFLVSGLVASFHFGSMDWR